MKTDFFKQLAFANIGILYFGKTGQIKDKIGEEQFM